MKTATLAIVALSLGLWFGTSSASEYGGTGNEFLPRCIDAVRVQDDPSHVQEVDEILASYCMGFVDGIVGMNTISRQFIGKGWFCLPQDATTGQDVRVVAKYMKDHPKYLNMPQTMLVIMALKDAFPCKSQ